jgi:hypothetical protein
MTIETIRMRIHTLFDFDRSPSGRTAVGPSRRDVESAETCGPVMSVYRDELLDAERNGLAAYEAMEQWVSRPPEARDDVPGAVLEGYARALRESRERFLKLLADHGNRDDIVEALAKSERYHRSLGLSIRDKPEPIEPE